jgi:hypothetical protein
LENVFGPEDQNGHEGSVFAIEVSSFTPTLISSLQRSQVVMVLLRRSGIDQGKVFHTEASIPSIDLLHLSDA